MGLDAMILVFWMFTFICQGCILSPCLFNLFAENIMQNSRLDEAQAGIRIPRRNINNFRYAEEHHPYGRKWRTKEPFDESERGEWKSWLKTQHSENEDHGSITGPITAWQIDGETVETVRDFIFLASKVTAHGDCSHEIKRCLLLRRKAMTNLVSILKSRAITLPTKVHLVKAVVFPVFMYGCEIWTIKKAEHRRIDAFELWCWRRLLESLAQQGDPISQS